MIYSFIRKKMLVATPEERVRQNFVALLVNRYGYPLEVMAEEYAPDYHGRGARSTRADLVVYQSPEDLARDYNAFLVVECKADNVKIRLEDFYQGTEYAAKVRAQFLILHNAKETQFFSVDQQKIPNKQEAFHQIVSIPRFEELGDERALDAIRSQTKTFTREEFTKLLRACHNIIRNNDKLSPEAAFDEISKILFMKIQYERDHKGSEVFTLSRFRQLEQDYEQFTRPTLRLRRMDMPYMQVLFGNTKAAFSQEQLFDPEEPIRIRQNSFEQILAKLEGYNLSDTQDDVKGIAFEEFLGTTFRGGLGQFFTPRPIVDFMVHVLDPMEGELICDPACGSGGFLIKAFEYVRDKIEQEVRQEKERLRRQLEGPGYSQKGQEVQRRINQQIAEMQEALNRELDTGVPGGRLYRLSHECIYGADANPRMARTSKMNMIMHGDGHSGVYHHDGFLNVEGIYEGRFDVILTNPPFGARISKDQKVTENDRMTPEQVRRARRRYGKEYDQALRQVEDNIGRPLLSLFDVGKYSGLTEVLFLERCLRLLKPGGRMGMVLPEGVLNTANLRRVREYIEGRARILLICSIPQDVFMTAGATVKPSLVFFKRFTPQEEQAYQQASQRAHDQARAPYLEEEGQLRRQQGQLRQKRTRTPEERHQLAVLKKRLQELDAAVEEAARPLLREYFDYEIPVAMVEDAGITSVGTLSAGNQLPQLLEEFSSYRREHPLWQAASYPVSYRLAPRGEVYRVTEEGEERLP